MSKHVDFQTTTSFDFNTQELKRAEREKWVEKIDVLTDKTYWQHAETDEIVHEEPDSDRAYVPRLNLNASKKKK